MLKQGKVFLLFHKTMDDDYDYEYGNNDDEYDDDVIMGVDDDEEEDDDDEEASNENENEENEEYDDEEIIIAPTKKSHVGKKGMFKIPDKIVELTGSNRRGLPFLNKNEIAALIAVRSEELQRILKLRPEVSYVEIMKLQSNWPAVARLELQRIFKKPQHEREYHLRIKREFPDKSYEYWSLNEFKFFDSI